MPGTTISVFSEPEDFQAALREAGLSKLLVTEGGHFQARMTRMVLHRISLSSAEERLSRVAFMCLAPGLVRVSLPTQTGTRVSGGIEIRSGEIATHGADAPLHERLSAPCRWGDIVLPAQYLARYGRALLGAAIVVPPGPGCGGQQPKSSDAWLHCTLGPSGSRGPGRGKRQGQKQPADWNKN